MKTVELTDEVWQEEPVGWLVFSYDQDEFEYKLFCILEDAKEFAWLQIEESEEENWPIYPLWASKPE